jgi:hypothetical protein
MRSILLCAAISLVPAYAIAQNMPLSQSITLAVQDKASSGSDGFTNSTASNGVVYACKFSGGTGKGGEVVFQIGARATVIVQLADNRYVVDGVRFPDDPHDELSFVFDSPAGMAVIRDTNDEVQTATYEIRLKDSQNGATFPCRQKVVHN